MKLAAILITAAIFLTLAYAFANRKNRMQISTDVVIEAPASVVWSVLTDGNDLSWNPFMSKLEGNLEVGSQLEVSVGLGKQMTFRPTVLVADTDKELRWLGRLIAPGVFDGEHVFELEALPDGTTRLNHWEEFEGVLVPFFGAKLIRDTVPGFQAMNEALKAKAESLHS